MDSRPRRTRKQIEEELRKSEEKFSKAFRQSPMAVMLSSAKDSRYIEVNDTFEHITGWRRDEVIGRTHYDIGLFVEPGQRAHVVQRLLSGETVRNVELRIHAKTGEVRTCLGSAELIEINGEPCMVAVRLPPIEARPQSPSTAGLSHLTVTQPACPSSECRSAAAASSVGWAANCPAIRTHFEPACGNNPDRTLSR